MKFLKIFKRTRKFPEFKAFNKIPRLSREITITEKLDGSNGILYIDKNYNIFAGSRKRWLWGSTQKEIHADNHGFAKWVKENQEELRQLGPGYHYGEWMGQGIQRNYGLKEKRFYLFNVKKWIKHDEPMSQDDKRKNCPKCCYVVPVLYRGNWFQLIDDDSEYAPTWQLMKLRLHGSIAVPGFKNPEGIVIYHSASGQLFKKTIENDEYYKTRKK